MDSPLIFEQLGKAGLATCYEDPWSSDLVQCRGITQKNNACRRRIPEPEQFEKRKGELSAFPRIRDSDGFHNAVTELIDAMHCYQHRDLAVARWEGWWARKTEEMRAELQRNVELTEQCLKQDESLAGRSSREAHPSEALACSGERTHVGNDFSEIDDENDYEDDTSPVSSRSASPGAATKGGWSPDPSNGSPSTTPVTIPDTDISPLGSESRGSSSSAGRHDTKHDETPTKPPAQTHTRLKRAITPEYTDNALGQYTYWSCVDPTTKWTLLKIIEKPFDKKDSKPGCVYVLQNETNPSYCKVGHTIRDLKKRLNEQKRCHDFNPVWRTDLFYGAYRVETLVKEDLVRERLKVERCRSCRRGHNEWFFIDHTLLGKKVKMWTDIVQSLYDGGELNAVGKEILSRAYEVTPDRLIKTSKSVSGANEDTARILEFSARTHTEVRRSPASASQARNGPTRRDGVPERGELSETAARKSSVSFRTRMKSTVPLTAQASHTAEPEWVAPFSEVASLEEVLGTELHGLATYVSKGTQTEANYRLEEDGSVSVPYRKTLWTRVQAKARSALQKSKRQPLKNRTNSTAPAPGNATLNKVSTVRTNIQRQMSSFSFIGGRRDAETGKEKTSNRLGRLMRASTLR
ncbi:hypothetical protein VUR80DRAFT_6350 [Thermomyces stellatus]